LEKKTYTSWTTMDDLGLKYGTESAEYQHLVKMKGIDEV